MTRCHAVAGSTCRRLFAVLAAVVLSSGCGDGESPIGPPPDPPRPTTVTVSPATAEFSALGATVRLTAEVRDQNGQAMAAAAVAWSSGNASVATVDATGLVTAVANGAATVTATSGAASGSAAVTVEQTVHAVMVSPAADTLLAFGDTVRLAAEAQDANGHAVAGTELSWASSDTTVATVDATGLVTAVANGAVTVTATWEAVSGSAAVTVEQAARAVTVSPGADTLLAVGDTVRLAAEAADANGNAVAGAEFSWSSSDTTVTTVDTTGLVTAMANGAATVTATSGAASGSATVTVEQAVNAVTVSPAADTLLAVGDTVRLAAEARDGNGNAVVGAEFSWSSSDTTVATVDATGLVTAVANGAATVTATWGAVSASARVTVAQAISTVRVLPRSLSLPVGDTARLSAMALDLLGTEVTDAAFEWRSSDATIATVDGSGLVRAAAVGVATITAASGGVRDSTRVSVLPDDPSDHHAALTAGLPERPFVNATVGGTEGSTATVGTLRLGLNPDAFPVIVSKGERPSVLVAASRLGRGRVVAFPGQDFLSPGKRATLLGNANAARLLANAVRWTGAKSAPLRVLVDNRAVADALEAQGIHGVEVVGRRGPYVRDWSASALADADVAVVLANDWGTPRLAEASVGPLRTFAERGGGLVVAASALHWNWWIEQHHGPLTADAVLRDTGISWNEDWIYEIGSATTTFDARLLPSVVWAQYIGGGSLDATQMALLPGLFNTALEFGRTSELDLALSRLVRETPSLPTSSTVPEARVSAEVAEELGPHEWPETHPWAVEFPGLPAADAIVADGTVTVDANLGEFPPGASKRERHIPLGFYAPPGASVTIEVSSGHATGDLRVSVGELHDNLRQGYAAQPVWRRAPWLRREFPLADRSTDVSNAYGGSIALIVPEDYTATIPVTVRGAIPMAVYTAGESNAAEWFADLDAGAPQAIIQVMGGIRLVISTERARGVDDPGDVSAFWEGFNRHHAELSGEPVPRAFESVWIFDPQVGWGYANAGYVRINYPLHGEHWVLVPGTAEGRAWLATLPGQGPTQSRVPPQTGYSPAEHGVDWWLFGHELGHQWQTEDWTGHGITEVGVNLFTMYTLGSYVFGGDDSDLYTEPWNPSCAPRLDHGALANWRWSISGPCERLALYRQLIAEFGWEPMKAVFHSYYDPMYPRSKYGGALDGFAIRFSAVVQRDLVGFFRKWEYPLSDSAAATIRSFGHKEWLPPGW